MGNRVPILVEEEEVIEQESVPPSFAEDLQPRTVNRDEASSWVLPKVIIGSAALLDVVVIPDLFLTNVIDYDAQSQTISFAGSDSDFELKTGFFKLKITLIDVNGLEKEYTQTIVVSGQKQTEAVAEPQSEEEKKEDLEPESEQAETVSPEQAQVHLVKKPQLSFEAIEINESIAKPSIIKIESSGIIGIKFSAQRM